MKRTLLCFTLFLALPLGGILLAQSDLQSTDAKVRQKAVKQLADSGGAGAQKCEALAGLVRDPAPDVRDEVLIALEVIDSNLEGRPHSMKSLSSKLGIPYTSVSRIVYSLTAEAQPGGVLKLVPDSKDRRRKHIELDADALKRMGSHVRALEKAMIDYYGSSVYKLKKDQPN